MHPRMPYFLRVQPLPNCLHETKLVKNSYTVSHNGFHIEATDPIGMPNLLLEGPKLIPFGGGERQNRMGVLQM